jgi:flagella synthesis protein FlgN
LGEEIALLREFISLLRNEQELLKQNGGEELLALIDTKNALANKLGELARWRERKLLAMDLPHGRPGMEAWLGQNATDVERQAWSWLCELATEARDLNAINGKLIGLHMQHNQQALTALTAAADKATTYGPDGHQQSGLGSRILGKA